MGEMSQTGPLFRLAVRMRTPSLLEERLEELYEELRPLMFSIAYRMLGARPKRKTSSRRRSSASTASRFVGVEIESPKAYLSAVTTRLSIDHLRSARVRRESYVGTWLPEPLLTDTESDASQHAETADSLSLGFLVLLESLTPGRARGLPAPGGLRLRLRRDRNRRREERGQLPTDRGPCAAAGPVGQAALRGLARTEGGAGPTVLRSGRDGEHRRPHRLARRRCRRVRRRRRAGLQRSRVRSTGEIGSPGCCSGGTARGERLGVSGMRLVRDQRAARRRVPGPEGRPVVAVSLDIADDSRPDGARRHQPGEAAVTSARRAADLGRSPHQDDQRGTRSPVHRPTSSTHLGTASGGSSSSSSGQRRPITVQPPSSSRLIVQEPDFLQLGDHVLGRRAQQHRATTLFLESLHEGRHHVAILVVDAVELREV